jgi:hypothetical protein
MEAVAESGGFVTRRDGPEVERCDPGGRAEASFEVEEF